MNLKFTNIASQQKEVPQLIETENKKGYVDYGLDNKYPYYLYTLLNNSPLFSSIITTMVDYVMGDGIEINNLPKYINKKQETVIELIKKLVFDFCTYGGFSFQIIRNKFNEIASLSYVDFRHVRISPEGDEVYYSNFEKYRNGKNIIKYPRYIYGAKQQNCIYYYKGISKGHYPLPSYIGAVKSIEITTQITDFHLNQILNCFNPAVVINMNNGNVDEDSANEIRERFEEHYMGVNGSKILLCFNDSQEHATTIERLTDDNFDQKYQTLTTQVQTDIYTAFRFNPILSGTNTTTGFNKQEFSEAFTLYNKTVIKPIQNIFEDIFNNIYGENTIKFIPFQIDWGDIKENGNIPVQEEEENNNYINTK